MNQDARAPQYEYPKTITGASAVILYYAGVMHRYDAGEGRIKEEKEGREEGLTPRRKGKRTSSFTQTSSLFVFWSMCCSYLLLDVREKAVHVGEGLLASEQRRDDLGRRPCLSIVAMLQAHHQGPVTPGYIVDEGGLANIPIIQGPLLCLWRGNGGGNDMGRLKWSSACSPAVVASTCRLRGLPHL